MLRPTRFLPLITKRFLRTRPHRKFARPRPSLTPEAIENAWRPAKDTSPPTEVKEEMVEEKKEPPPPQGLAKYAYRWETIEPSGEERKNADDFFLRYPPKLLWTEAKFKKIDFGDVPEVAFLGRSNVGKSSLLNALLNNKDMAYTSSKPGRTRLLSAYAINNQKLVLLDMPGYGHASREDWGIQVMKYLRSRKQLRRVYVLIDATHGPKGSDILLLQTLATESIPFQIVLSKVDRLKKPGELQKVFEDARALVEYGLGGAKGLGEILATAAAARLGKERKAGLTDLRFSILAACGLSGTKRKKRLTFA